MNLHGSFRPWLLSVSTGVMLVAAFPRPDLEFLAWVALAPLLVAIYNASRLRRALALGYLSGFVFFAGTHYWMRDVMQNYGGVGSLESVGILLAFAALMALYFAWFASLAWMIVTRLSDRTIFWALPALWVAIEYARVHLLTGLPFLLMGYSVAGHLAIAQLARYGGVYLLSFLVVLFNAGVFLLIRQPSRRRGTALAAALFALAFFTLAGSLLPPARADRTAYLVQADARLDQDWTRERSYVLLDDLAQRVVAAWARNQSRSGLVVLPEIPASFYYTEDMWVREKLGSLASQTQSGVVANVITFADPVRQQPLNSAVLVGRYGTLEGRYDKIHLVPFGEYIPYKPVFFFAGRLTAEVGDFVPGARAEPLGREHRLAALICYEGIFPDLVRQFSAAGAEVLVNISNDAWYGTTAAREQLLLMSRLRAIENHRWLLRATNTGITAVVDPYGRMQTFPPDKRAVHPVRFGYIAAPSFYAAWGYWFPVLAVVAAALALLRAWWVRRNSRPAPVSEMRSRQGVET